MTALALRPSRFAIRHAGHFKWAVILAWVAVVGGAIAGWWSAGLGWFWPFVISFLAVFAVGAWARWQRERLIREQPIPHFLKRKLRGTYPQLTQKDAEMVERGLRQFFLACHRSKGKFVAMPSKAVDAMWHEFILHTQAYRDWCALALGRFLHHTPAEVLGPQAKHNDGLRRAWYWACKDESINPRTPTRLPLLFALDGKLAIADGFRYVPDCHGVRPLHKDDSGVSPYCATDFGGSGSSSASGDADGFGGCESSSSSDGGGSSDGSSDGGSSGCGGGCGGGGGD